METIHVDNDEKILSLIDNKLRKIQEILLDPYKDSMCKYSIIEDIMSDSL